MTLGTGLFEAFVLETGVPEEIRRSAAGRIRRFLKNHRGCRIDSIEGVLIYESEDDESLAEGIKQRET